MCLIAHPPACWLGRGMSNLQTQGAADRRYLEACEERDAARLAERRLEERARAAEAESDAKAALTKKLLQEVEELRQDKLELMEERQRLTKDVGRLETELTAVEGVSCVLVCYAQCRYPPLFRSRPRCEGRVRAFARMEGGGGGGVLPLTGDAMPALARWTPGKETPHRKPGREQTGQPAPSQGGFFP